MKKTLILIIAIIVIGLGAFYYFSNKTGPPGENGLGGRTYPLPENFPDYKLTDIIKDAKNNKFRSGKYNITGALVDIFTCPPCPTGAVCIQCPGEFLIVTEDVNKLLPTEEKVLILADDFDQFEVGRYYEFSISIDEEMQEIQLLGYRTLNK